MLRRLERVWYPAPDNAYRPMWRVLLTALSWIFGWMVQAREGIHRLGMVPARRVPARIISIGNLTVGGAGKTPAVIYLAQRCMQAGHRVAVLSRGYGRATSEERSLDFHTRISSREVGDEPLLIARRCPGVTVWVGPDRARLADRAVNEGGANLILLDDGMQHRKLARDVDILVVDESVGFGNGRLLPRGPLREPLSALRRVNMVWVRESVAQKVDLPPFEAPVVRARYRPSTVLAPNGTEHPAYLLMGRKVIALAALARPDNFLRTLESLGVEPAGKRLLPDHAPFPKSMLARLKTEVEATGAIVVTTEKDQMRLPPDFPAWILKLEVDIVEGAEHLHKALGLDG